MGRIKERVARYARLPSSFMEGMQILRYQESEQYLEVRALASGPPHPHATTAGDCDGHIAR